MKFLDEITDLLKHENVRHIILPRKVLALLCLCEFLLLTTAFSFWRGIWIIVSMPILVFTGAFVRMSFRIWRKYYAVLPFILRLAVEIVLAALAAYQIQNFILRLID